MLGGVLVRPTDPGPRPAIIVLHGFQPAGTNGASLVEPLAAEFAGLGYVALALSMRGWPPSGGVDDCGLHQPDDIAVAVDHRRTRVAADDIVGRHKIERRR